MAAASCPLCDADVAHHDALRHHLAAVHALEDDPGMVNRVGDISHLAGLTDFAVLAEVVDRISGSGNDLDAEAVAVPETRQPSPPLSRVYDPSADDALWRPVTIGVGGVLLLVLLVLTILVTR